MVKSVIKYGRCKKPRTNISQLATITCHSSEHMLLIVVRHSDSILPSCCLRSIAAFSVEPARARTAVRSDCQLLPPTEISSRKRPFQSSANECIPCGQLPGCSPLVPGHSDAPKLRHRTTAPRLFLVVQKVNRVAAAVDGMTRCQRSTLFACVLVDPTGCPVLCPSTSKVCGVSVQCCATSSALSPACCHSRRSSTRHVTAVRPPSVGRRLPKQHLMIC